MRPISRYLLLWGLMVLIIGLSLTVDAQAAEFGTRVLRVKDEGADVAILQNKLKEAGLYHDRVDGVFGKKTEDAVIKLQKIYGLEGDGVVGSRTYEVLPQSNQLPMRANITWEDLIFIARVIHAEARGESFKGQVAVGAVILNRLESRQFPNTVREVILQEGQFCTIVDGQVQLYPSNTAIEAARAALLGYDPTFGALFFYNPRTAAKQNWVATRPVAVRIGGHVFAY